jgi:hypothetical protein
VLVRLTVMRHARLLGLLVVLGASAAGSPAAASGPAAGAPPPPPLPAITLTVGMGFTHDLARATGGDASTGHARVAGVLAATIGYGIEYVHVVGKVQTTIASSFSPGSTNVNGRNVPSLDVELDGAAATQLFDAMTQVPTAAARSAGTGPAPVRMRRISPGGRIECERSAGRDLCHLRGVVGFAN